MGSKKEYFFVNKDYFLEKSKIGGGNGNFVFFQNTKKTLFTTLARVLPIPPS